MKKKLLIGTLSTVMSLGFLSGCNTGNNEMYDTEGVDYSPVRYDQVDNNNRNNGNNIKNNRYQDPSPGRFDTNENRSMDRTNGTRDRSPLDVNNNNRNTPFLNNNDGDLNDNVNMRNNGRDSSAGNRNVNRTGR